MSLMNEGAMSVIINEVFENARKDRHDWDFTFLIEDILMIT